MAAGSWILSQDPVDRADGNYDDLRIAVSDCDHRKSVSILPTAIILILIED